MLRKYYLDPLRRNQMWSQRHDARSGLPADAPLDQVRRGNAAAVSAGGFAAPWPNGVIPPDQPPLLPAAAPHHAVPGFRAHLAHQPTKAVSGQLLAARGAGRWVAGQATRCSVSACIARLARSIILLSVAEPDLPSLLPIPRCACLPVCLPACLQGTARLVMCWRWDWSHLWLRFPASEMTLDCASGGPPLLLT